MARPGSFLRLAQLDFSATSCSTPFMRSGFRSRGPLGLFSITRHRHYIVAQDLQLETPADRGPAATASSSRKDCPTNAYALLPGARRYPVRSISGNAEV